MQTILLYTSFPMAWMLLIFWLGRPDVFPVADLGIRKGMAVIDGLEALPDADAMRARAEAWRPHRSTASWYLWRASEGVLEP